MSINFRQKAEECYAAFKETSDPAEAAAADAYNEAADEIERLGHKVYELQVELQEAEASVGLQRDFVEADVHKLRRENERLAAENDWLRTALRAAQIGAGLAPTRPDDKNGDCNTNRG